MAFRPGAVCLKQWVRRFVLANSHRRMDFRYVSQPSRIPLECRMRHVVSRTENEISAYQPWSREVLVNAVMVTVISDKTPGAAAFKSRDNDTWCRPRRLTRRLGSFLECCGATERDPMTPRPHSTPPDAMIGCSWTHRGRT